MADGAIVAQGTLQQSARTHPPAISSIASICRPCPKAAPTRSPSRATAAPIPSASAAISRAGWDMSSFRSLYHQRCGCPIMEPYAWNIKPDPCHTTIWQVNGRIAEASLVVTGNEPTFTAYGGYHDAGDADRRTYHMDVPVTLLTTYEAFPQHFTDDQFNIPDKFNEKYQILGKGNGVPDILDEAMWGTMFWEYMQEPSGAIHWGTETKGYSPFTTYQNDTTRFGTEVVDSVASFAWTVHAHGPPYQAVQ